jgi:hypothetical protein
MSRDVPKGWYSAGSNDDLWGKGGTYKLVPWEALPTLPARAADLAWLANAPERDGGLGFSETEDVSIGDLSRRLDEIEEEARDLGLVVPPILRRFVLDPELHRRVPTCTSCYLDLPNRLDALPDGHDGRVLRFLNDQQCVIVWALRLVRSGHSVICLRPQFHEGTGETLEDVAALVQPMTCAPSLEDFLHRFFLENTIWYDRNRRALTADELAYVNAARQWRAANESH